MPWNQSLSRAIKGEPEVSGEWRSNPGRSRTDGGLFARDVERMRVIPDIGAVFGEYTYLVTEIAWGVLAVGLLYRADALFQAARTIAVLYPVAYVWDWYTLHVGVFDIQLRTGVDLLGIPIEEHLFMVVVPALVVGVHENLTDRPRTSSRSSVENNR